MAHDPDIGLLVRFGVGLQLFLSVFCFWHFWGELLLVHELDIGLQSSFHGSRLGAFLSFVQVIFSVWSRVVLPCSFLRNHCYLFGYTYRSLDTSLVSSCLHVIRDYIPHLVSAVPFAYWYCGAGLSLYLLSSIETPCSLFGYHRLDFREMSYY